MTVEAFRPLPPPLPPLSAWPQLRPLLQPASPGFDPKLLQSDPRDVRFELDPQSVRITDEDQQQWNTEYSVSADMYVSAPGVEAATVPVRYDVTIRNENATPAQMRAVNPFDPATIPPRTRIEVYGRDYAGTPLEASFRAMAEANDLASIDDLRLSLEMTEDGELRVMTGSNALFDAPREGGPASLPAERADFTRHTAMLEDPAGADAAGYRRMLLDGTPPDGTLRTVEDVEGDRIHGIMTETGSGEVNDVVWTLDAQGRPTEAEATLTWEPGSGGRDSDRIETNAQSKFRTDNAMKGTGDDVGHMIAYRFVNGHGPVNMFPQFGLFNRGPYARMEQEWSDWLSNGMEVRIEVDLAPDDVQRPDEVRVDYEVIDPASGKVVYDPSLIVFENADGQRFEAVAESRMDEMIEEAA